MTKFGQIFLEDGKRHIPDTKAISLPNFKALLQSVALEAQGSWTVESHSLEVPGKHARDCGWSLPRLRRAHKYTDPAHGSRHSSLVGIQACDTEQTPSIEDFSLNGLMFGKSYKQLKTGSCNGEYQAILIRDDAFSPFKRGSSHATSCGEAPGKACVFSPSFMRHCPMAIHTLLLSLGPLATWCLFLFCP